MKYISWLTRCNDEDRILFAQYYAELPDAGRIEVHRIQSGLMRRYGAKRESGRRPEFLYAMLLLALRRIYNAEFQIGSNRKGGTADNIEAEGIHKIRILGDRKKGSPPAVAKRIVNEHYDLIDWLKKRGTSWREIARHLDKRYKKKISHVSLQKNYEKITVNWEEADAGRFSPEISARLAKYFAGLSDAARIGIFRDQIELIRANRKSFDGRGRAEVFYTMFLSALYESYHAEEKKKQETIPDIPPGLPAGPRKKIGPKKNKLDKQLYDLVKKRRDDGWTWPRIARNVAQYNRLKIGYVWLRQSFNQITREREMRGE